jgi:hypothetical protein
VKTVCLYKRVCTTNEPQKQLERKRGERRRRRGETERGGWTGGQLNAKDDMVKVIIQ